jgi:hypothetical protein
MFQVLETNAKALNPVTFVGGVFCLSIVQVIFASLLTVLCLAGISF